MFPRDLMVSWRLVDWNQVKKYSHTHTATRDGAEVGKAAIYSVLIRSEIKIQNFLPYKGLAKTTTTTVIQSDHHPSMECDSQWTDFRMLKWTTFA